MSKGCKNPTESNIIRGAATAVNPSQIIFEQNSIETPRERMTQCEGGGECNQDQSRPRVWPRSEVDGG